MQQLEQAQEVVISDLESAYLLQDAINKQKKKLKEDEARLDELLEKIVETNRVEDGVYRVKVSTRDTRRIIPEKFAEKFPDAYKKLASIAVSIGIKEAEEEVGKNNLEGVISISSTTSKKIEKIKS